MFVRAYTESGQDEGEHAVLIAGRYRLADLLGRGGMGEVWRAEDEVLGRAVAVKLLPDNGADQEATARFRMEARTAASLSDPHVVAVHDFGEQDGRCYLVMELVNGQTVAEELHRNGPLPAERVARIGAQTAAGLAGAHRQGIVHRDIKPANLFTTADGHVKIGDFGIARFSDDRAAALTSAGQIVGTSLYLAPERALGRPAGPSADVYALGCVLYELTTGRPPFGANGGGPAVVLQQHLETPPEPPRRSRPDLPPAFEASLLAMLAKDPEQRPTAAQVAEWFSTPATWQPPAGAPPAPLPTAHAVLPGAASGHGRTAGPSTGGRAAARRGGGNRRAGAAGLPGGSGAGGLGGAAGRAGRSGAPVGVALTPQAHAVAAPTAAPAAVPAPWQNPGAGPAPGAAAPGTATVFRAGGGPRVGRRGRPGAPLSTPAGTRALPAGRGARRGAGPAVSGRRFSRSDQAWIALAVAAVIALVITLVSLSSGSDPGTTGPSGAPAAASPGAAAGTASQVTENGAPLARHGGLTAPVNPPGGPAHRR